MSKGKRDTGRLPRLIGSVLWALIPVLTLGFGTVPVMIHAAVRTKKLAQALLTVPYLGATALVFLFDPDVSSTQEGLFATGLLFNIVVGSGHTFAIRNMVWGDPGGRTTPRQRALQDRQQAVLAARDDARAAREAARALAESDPAQARELQIGRADIEGREFPDGGLVDVNNVPSWVLARTLRVSVTKAAEIVRRRADVGGFTSVEDLSVTMGLPPHHLDQIADRLVFLPPGA
ncbi:ComEA family DNA-binding protein [Streptomyces sp. NPDC048172]|uniref:ComEA family DNA-binding protein n=1 Tax=Streptomyces sp. NPDC048172 TaxID=3365505 RepID=UPI0037148BA7